MYPRTSDAIGLQIACVETEETGVDEEKRTCARRQNFEIVKHY
jgi:hypothetical protein